MSGHCMTSCLEEVIKKTVGAPIQYVFEDFTLFLPRREIC